MSKIDDLINELCPDGVEFLSLNNICEIKTGKLNANSKVNGGIYPFFTCDALPYRINSYSFDTEAILIAGNGNVGQVFYYKGKFDVYQRTYVLHNFKTMYNINISFIFYYLQAFLKKFLISNSKIATIPYITLPILQKFFIPIPPLAIQEEIVTILDKFTELQEKLQEELLARVKQFEFYRDITLNANIKNYAHLKFKDIVTYIQPNPYIVKSSNYDNSFNTPVLTPGKTFILGYTDETEGIYEASKNNPIILFDDFTGAIKWVDFPFKVKSSACKILKSEKALLKYIFYVMSKINFSSSEHQRLWISKYSQFNISIPDIEEQKRIVSLIDIFYELCNNIQAGLPAEIEARQKQYEYYRDKLLTFKQKE